MPYTAEHKQETRKRIIQSARRLFNRNGFADVSIDEIMGEAGLTRGGFYKHFSAKEDLYKDAVLEFICADRPEPWQARHVDPAARGAALSRMIVDAYLSRRPFRRPRWLLPDDRAPLRRVARRRVGEGRLPPGARNDGRRLRRQSRRRRRAATRAGAGPRRRWWSAAWCSPAPSTIRCSATSSATAPARRRWRWPVGKTTE